MYKNSPSIPRRRPATDLIQVFGELAGWVSRCDPSHRVLVDLSQAPKEKLCVAPSPGAFPAQDRYRRPNEWQMATAGAIRLLSSLVDEIEDHPQFNASKALTQSLHRLVPLLGRPIDKGFCAGELSACLVDLSAELQRAYKRPRGPALAEVMASSGGGAGASLNDLLHARLRDDEDCAGRVPDDLQALAWLLDDHLAAPGQALDLSPMDPETLTEFDRLGLWQAFTQQRRPATQPLTVVMPQDMTVAPPYLPPGCTAVWRPAANSAG